MGKTKIPKQPNPFFSHSKQKAGRRRPLARTPLVSSPSPISCSLLTFSPSPNDLPAFPSLPRSVLPSQHRPATLTDPDTDLLPPQPSLAAAPPNHKLPSPSLRPQPLHPSFLLPQAGLNFLPISLHTSLNGPAKTTPSLSSQLVFAVSSNIPHEPKYVRRSFFPCFFSRSHLC